VYCELWLNSPILEAHLLAVKTIERSPSLLAMSVFLLVLVADNGTAADIRLPIDPDQSSMAEFGRFLASRHEEAASPEVRKSLFREFLRWSRALAERKSKAP
jgi:hypothetical protein